MPLTVAVDVDETVADMLGEWLRRYNEASGDNVLPEDITDWVFHPQLRPEFSGENKQRLYDILGEPDFYRHILPIRGARQAVGRLRKAGARVIFASSCANGTEVHKLAFLKRYEFLYDFKDFVSVSDKSLVRADVLIDDGPHNIEAFPGKAYLIDLPHNREFHFPETRVTRVQNLNEAVSHILNGARL